MQTRRQIKAFLTAMVLVMALGGGAARAEGLQVVVDIKPIHSLVAAILQGTGEAVYLVHQTATPHDYALRPSDMKTLQGADLVVWGGPHLSSFLVKPLAGLDALAWDLSAAEGVQHRLARRPGVAPLDTAEAPDPHLWLDTDNALRMARSIRDALQRVAPNPVYDQNLQAFEIQLGGLNRVLADTLRETKGYLVVAHDSLQYLTEAHGVETAGILTPDPDFTMSLSLAADVHQLLMERPGGCVVEEPGYREGFARSLTQGTDAQIIRLDPLGADIPPGPDHYSATMRGLALGIAACLGR